MWEAGKKEEEFSVLQCAANEEVREGGLATRQVERRMGICSCLVPNLSSSTSPRAYKERACNSYSDSIDSEIKSVTKNSNTKLGLLVYWRSILRI